MQILIWNSLSDPSLEPEGVHHALALDLDLSAGGAVEAAEGVEEHLCLVGDLDLHHIPGSLEHGKSAHVRVQVSGVWYI